MEKPFRVWDSNHEFGDVDIAQFANEEDAELFVRTKASRRGGFNFNLWVGTDWSNRRQIPAE